VDPVTLYPNTGGQPVTTSTRSEYVRLRATGYSEEPLFDPAEHTVDEVKEHIAENPADAPRVVAAERTTRSRKTIVGDDGTVSSEPDNQDVVGT
jgi:hypothetical protein